MPTPRLRRRYRAPHTSALIGQIPGLLLQHETLAPVRFGSLADIGAQVAMSANTPKSGQTQRRSVCPLSAMSGHRRNYSMTASARAISDGDTDSPIALAVLRLSTSSNLVGWRNGRSPGLAPLRMRLT